MRCKMRKRKVWRYYCDFCKKAGCSGGHLKNHEKHCTLNPNRDCGMCKARELEQPDLSKAILLLPNPDEYLSRETDCDGDNIFICFDGLEDAVDKVLPELRDFVENCPACIMAALRQRGIPVPVAKKFNYRDECQYMWAELNRNQEDYSDEI